VMTQIVTRLRTTIAIGAAIGLTVFAPTSR
jgi:hypothetical protein